MEYIIHLLLLIVSAATIHGQDLTAEAQLDISVGEIRGTGTSFNIQVWLGNPASWREWGPWGACSGSCGVGLQTRSRRCWIRETEIITTVNERDITGEAANNQGLSPNARQGEFSGIVTGEGCFGYAAQVRGCPLVPCVGTLLPWGPWSQCGVTCGSSTRFRRRVCQGPGTCVGDLNDSEPCGFGPCYSWTEWTSYSACSTTCGSGQSFRTRKCATPDGTQAPDISACPDVLNLGTFQSQPCSIGRCYSLTQWSEYSTCSATCGNGQSFRTRQCVATDGTVDLTFAECPGSFNNRGFEIQACNQGRCYRFTDWTSWSSCSVACGDGRITRTRRCIDIATNVDAPDFSSCEDPDRFGVSQSQSCNIGLCYSWTQWTEYSTCTATCGNGQLFRNRQCVATDGTVDPTFAGCPDLTGLGGFEAQTCNVQLCYSWTRWSEYSTCSATCGDGQSFRNRQCVAADGTVDNTFSECPDLSGLGGFEAITCNLKLCYSWTQWTEYSTCTATCGNGQSFRSRQCVATDGTVDSTFAECPDPFNNRNFETQTCNLGRCYQFTEWTSWTSCSASCGDGQIGRSRKCVDIATNLDARDFKSCDDPLNLGIFQSQRCNLRLCYSWTRWSEYSTCTTTCGDGQSFRSRQCVATDGTIDPTNAECPDQTGLGGFEAITCNLKLCYSWTRWSEYSTCSATCGDGQSFRSRQCVATDGTIDNTLAECPDLTGLGQLETRRCNQGQCYQFTEWTSWTSCSVACGDGQITRTRRCIAIATNIDAVDFSSCEDPNNLGVYQSQQCNLGLCYSWTRWSEYSTCTTTCGDGQSFRSRQCVATDGTIDPTNAECPDQTGLGGFEAITCNLKLCYSWSRWSEYSTCSATCGDGQSFRSRQCVATDGTIDNTLAECPDQTGLGQLETRRCNQGQCYQFTEWTSWTSCSVACGDGQITRTRRCIAIATNIDAVDFSSCEDPNNLGVYQSQQCNLGLCYSWTRWSEYSTCTATCGDGQSFRSRQCVATDGTIDPTNAECPDQTGLGGFEAITCSLKLCYSWSRWSEYSTCSATCGDGQSFRSRQCVATDGTIDNTLAECPDQTGLGQLESRRCNQGQCYQFTEWTPWTSCSVACGDGQITRTRRCIAIATNIDAVDFSSCEDPNNLGVYQSQQCNLGLCYSWTRWSEYSTCTATCGDGQSFRSRQCVATDGTIDPTNAECPDQTGLGGFEAITCNLKLCYSWTRWSEYSTCTTTCGDGQSFRTRQCVATDGTVDNTFAECPDLTGLRGFETQSCFLKPCYSWTEWTPFSECSVSCGDGQSYRSRSCSASDGSNAPSPAECPDPENLSSFQTQSCRLGACYGFTEWTEWTTCSVTCGQGQITRRRRCIDIGTNLDAPIVSSCFDPEDLGVFQRQPCNLKLCYSWTQWTQYSQCSASCGEGQSFRTRRCIATDGTEDLSLKECPDVFGRGSFEGQNCNLGPCYSWTIWSGFSDCSVTCGSGIVSRARRCSTEKGDISSDENCIIRGQDGAFDTRDCQQDKCYFWTAWSAYSPCSTTCGDGQSFRSRTCSATDGTITNDRSKCGNEKDPFNLDFFQRQDCNLGPCYRFAEWGAWSRCDSRCGQGNMQRVRSCVTINGQSGPNSGCSNNPDDFIIRATCMKPACPGVFRQWSQWGQCSLTCHAGVRVRTRACSTDRCIGRSREAQICNDISCDDRPIGRWTAWSNWSPCTNPCGGTSTQTRVCIGGRSSTDCGRDCEEYRRTKTCTDCPRGGPFSIGSCSVLENVREDCGFGGISPEECAFRQCCYDDTVAPGIPWCYEQSQNFILNVGAQRSLQPPTPPAPVSATAPTPAAVNNASTEAADGN